MCPGSCCACSLPRWVRPCCLARSRLSLRMHRAVARDQGHSRDIVTSCPTDPHPDEIQWLLAEPCPEWFLLHGGIGSKAGGREEQQPGESVPCLSLGKPVSAGASDPSDPMTQPAPSLLSEKTPFLRGSVCPSPAPLRVSEQTQREQPGQREVRLAPPQPCGKRAWDQGLCKRGSPSGSLNLCPHCWEHCSCRVRDVRMRDAGARDAGMRDAGSPVSRGMAALQMTRGDRGKWEDACQA